MSFDKLLIGEYYSKKDLSKIFDNPNIEKGNKKNTLAKIDIVKLHLLNLN